MMDGRFRKESSRESKGSTTLQKKNVEAQRPNKIKNAPDITDFMNDAFFGTINNDKKAYNLSGGRHFKEEEDSFDDSTRSNSSRLTQEWLEEARRMVASSPSRCESPTRLVGSPRFATVPGKPSASILDRRDPLSRSARRHRTVETFSGEILSKSATHSRSISESQQSAPNSSAQPSPASQVHQWFSNILKPHSSPAPLPSPTSTCQSNDPAIPVFDPTAPNLPPRLATHRKSRFQTEHSSPIRYGIPIPSRRTYKPAPILQDTNVLSPPKNLIESAHRRSVSSNTCSKPENEPLSPPKNLVESAHKRSISRSTCFIEKIAPKPNVNEWQKEEEREKDPGLNEFLKKQKTKIEKILNGELNSKAKIILSGPSNSTSSMASAIGYAWLMENRLMKNRGEVGEEGPVVVPVMNIRRGRMWKQRQAAWLFHHVRLDATSLLFADEVDLESLMMEGKLNLLVVGQDILKTNGEVGSQCTILTDNYCEDAYDLLQTPVLKKLMLAGILLDTENLNASVSCSMTRDAEAVQLLLVGSPPYYRNAVFDQLMQDQRDNSFIEALRQHYGKSPSEMSGRDNGAQMDHRATARKSTSISHHEDIRKSTSISHHEDIRKTPDKNSNNLRNLKPNNTEKSAPEAKRTTETTPNASNGKNKFFLAKWFGW